MAAFNEILNTWTVPTNPTTNHNQLIYFFTSLEDANGVMILQPVLQWGNNNLFGGQYWTLAVWFVYTVQGKTYSYYSTPINVGQGDQLQGEMNLIACYTLNGQPVYNAWGGTAVDQTTNTNTWAIFNTPAFPMAWANGAVLEAHGIVQCSDYPAAGATIFAQAPSVYQVGSTNPQYCATQNAVTPTWRVQYGNDTPSCNFNVNFGGSWGTTLYY